MMTKRITLLFVFILLVSTASNANADLEKCWQKQVQPIIDQYLTFDMQETENYFSHSMNPWDQGTYKIKGNLGVRPNSFFKRDTLTTERGKEYHSIVQYENNQLLFLDYGDTEWYAVTESMVVDQLVKTCRYSPVLILDYFYNYQVSESIESTVSTQVYQTTIGSYFISLFIDRGKEEVIKITATADLEKDDEYYGFGDVEEVFLYTDYASIKTFSFPKNIQILKLNNKLSDQVLLSNPVITSESPRLFEEPENYLIQKDKIVEPDITVEKYSENIHFINLHHCGTRSLMVEFFEFILVAEAPLNSKNGELLLDEVRKIAPGKPVRYFAFGHFHPHYTGGIRPFIHEGAQIICVKEDQSYVEFIANSPHTIKVDSLQLEPKAVDFNFITQEKVISDDTFEMKIYHIGAKSNHTSDYLIYYFPKEKMIFQDDLIRLNKNSNKENISKTTSGFYQAVKDLGLEVEEVVQNWHVFDKNNKMIFNFNDIERIMIGE